MQIYFYNPDDFDSFGAAILENRIIGAMAVFFQVSETGAKVLQPKSLASIFFFNSLNCFMFNGCICFLVHTCLSEGCFILSNV